MQYSDEEIIKSLPGFKNNYAEVNGTKIHYVAGGSGQPIPGWPETWWAYHKVMPMLATKYYCQFVSPFFLLIKGSLVRAHFSIRFCPLSY